VSYTNLIRMNLDFKFEVVADNTFHAFTGTCSGSRSDCCTRVGTRNAEPANAEQWGQFLELNAGVVQY